MDIHPLAGKHRGLAYYRFFKWQLSQFLFPGFRNKPFVHETFLRVRKGMTGATGNIYCGLHEFSDMGFLLHFLREEDTFIDVGANIGSYTVLASGVCRARSVSFEPVPSTFAHLRENMRLNNINSLTELWNAAAGRSRSQVKFTSSFDTVNHVITSDERQEECIEVDVFPVDEVLKNNDHIRLIKIDAEGFETEVLGGMQLLLKESSLKAIIIELNGSGGRYGYNEQDIHNNLGLYGFVPYSYEPFSRTLEKLETFNSLNTIYIRDVDFVQQRIMAAKKIEVFNERF